MNNYDQEIVCLHFQKLKQQLINALENKIGHCFILRGIKNKRLLALRKLNKSAMITNKSAMKENKSAMINIKSAMKENKSAMINDESAMKENKSAMIKRYEK